MTRDREISRSVAPGRVALACLTFVAVPSLLAGYLAIHSGLGFRVAGLAVLAGYVLCIAPGYLIQRYLFRLRAATPFETVLAAFVLGALVSPALWYVASSLNVGHLYVPLLIVCSVGIVVGFLWRCRRALRDRCTWVPQWSEMALVWLALSLTVIWSYSRTVVEFQDGQGIIRAYSDHAYHTMLIGELSRGVPADRVPFVTGPTQLAYHYMPDVAAEMIRRFTGAGVLEGYFHLALPMRYVFIAVACYLALVRRFGCWPALAGAGCLLGLVGVPDRYVLSNLELLRYLHNGYTAPFGLAGVFLALYWVSTVRDNQVRPQLLLASVLSGLLLWYKANLALPVLPAVAIVSLYELGRRRDWRFLLACLGIQLTLVGLRQWELAGADAAYGLAFAPLAFVKWWWSALGMSPVLDDLVRSGVDGLPSVLRWPIVFLVCLVYRFHVLIAVLAVLVVGFRFGRRHSSHRSYDLLVLGAVLACVVGFVLFPIATDPYSGRDLTWDISLHVFYMLSAFSVAMLGPIAVEAWRRAWRKGRLVRAVACVAFLLLAVQNAGALRRTALWETRVMAGRLTLARYEAWCEVAASTDPGSVVMHPWTTTDATWAGMFTQRRMVLDGYETWRGCYDASAVKQDVERFYSTSSAAEIAAILDRCRADYIMVDLTQPWRPPAGSPLREAFRNSEVAVYVVVEETRLADRGVGPFP